MVDQHILDGIRNSDRKIIKALYADAFGYCSSFILNNQGGIDDARDQFQEALVVLFNNARKSDFELTCRVKTYLYSIMRNKWLKKINKKKRGGLKLVIDEDPTKEYVIISDDTLEEKKVVEEKHDAVAAAMKLIKEDCHQLIMNYYFKKFDLSTIAEQMGYTYQFVKVKKNRCMEALKKRVKEVYSDG